LNEIIFVGLTVVHKRAYSERTSILEQYSQILDSEIPMLSWQHVIIWLHGYVWHTMTLIIIY